MSLDVIGKAFHAAVFLYYAIVNYNVVTGMMHAHELLGRPKDDPLVNRMISGCPTYFTGWSLTVVSIFWSVYAISPSLVFGDFLDVINPAWVNHAIHTTVAPIAILEFCLRARSERIWNGGFARGATMLSSFLMVYLFAISVAFIFKGTWPYPLLDPMNGYTFFPFVIFCHAIVCAWFSAVLFIGQKVREKTNARMMSGLKSKKTF